MDTNTTPNPNASRTRRATKEEIAAASDPDALLPIRTVCALVGLGATSIRQGVKKGTFPAPSHLNRRVVRWPARVIRAYLQERGAPDDPFKLPA